MTRIKFCGIRSAETAVYLNEILPDFAGFILAPQFRRFVPQNEVEKITALLDRRIMTVGVFVDNPYDEVERILKDGTVGIAQLHGSEDGDFIRRLKESTGKPVIKAFKVTSESDLERAYSSPADLVLLDSGTGTGKTFEWEIIKSFGRKYILAGGLCPENAADAVMRLHPYCLDVSSGIETDGVKDGEKMRKFALAARETEKER